MPSKHPPGFHPDPFRQFLRWYDLACSAGVPRPNAMTLATATEGATPSARIVLFKGLRDSSFLFFTNYQSRKGRELAANDRAALVFFWPWPQGEAGDKQVRIEGKVIKITREESEEYFATRPRGSQIGAWISRQSGILAGKETLRRADARMRSRFRGKKIPCPPFWGGYALVADRFEFWKAGTNRLHDRICYTRSRRGWRCFRLSP